MAKRGRPPKSTSTGSTNNPAGKRGRPPKRKDHMAATGNPTNEKKADSYRYPEAESPLRPEAGTQAQFRKKKPPATYRFDSSLSPALEWDGQNSTRELGEFLLACIQDAARLPAPHLFDKPRVFTLNDGSAAATVRGLEDAVQQLTALGKPFLDWTGKAERLSFDVPTLPLFVHERLSTAHIISTLKSHQKKQEVQLDLFGDPQHPIADQLLRAYEYKDKWVNRMVLGDSLVVMNSLLQYEGLGGQVQCIYMDPPYGVKFGSNFQPFVRKRDVKHNEDDDMTREPEMVKAYRDTWELGLHSYLTYMRDRLLLARELLTPSGSIFVQISDENLHHVRELMDEVFGGENFVSAISFVKTSGFSPKLISNVCDFLLWYSKDIEQVKYRQLQLTKIVGQEGATQYSWIESSDGAILRPMTREESENLEDLSNKYRVLAHGDASAQGSSGNSEPFKFQGQIFNPPKASHWKTTPDGMKKLAENNRLMVLGNSLRYKRYLRHRVNIS